MTKQENGAMALVRLLRGGQVTLPAETRKALKLAEGDYLEADVREGALVLKPVTVLDRETAGKKLAEIINRPKWRGPGPEPSEDEVMKMVVDEIHAMRREDEETSGSR